MKLSTALSLLMWLSPAVSQDNKSVSHAVDHVFQVTTFSYPGFKAYVKLWSTPRMPKAKGKVWTERESAIGTEASSRLQRPWLRLACSLAQNLIALWRLQANLLFWECPQSQRNMGSWASRRNHLCTTARGFRTS